MRKYIIISALLLPVALFAQKQDSVFLKNGKAISGNIYRMEEGKIYIAHKADTFVYSSDQVKMLMFCNKENIPCDQITDPPSVGKGIARSQTSSSNTSTFSSLDKNEMPDENFLAKDTEKGVATFTCNMCSGSGSLFISGAGNGRSTASYTFTMDKDKHYFLYVVKLLPGNYSWTYDDNNNNETRGKFSIGKAEEKKIVLFEKE